VIFFLLTGVKSSKEKEKEKEIYSTHSARIQPQIIDQLVDLEVGDKKIGY